jgi:hypothetical protein
LRITAEKKMDHQRLDQLELEAQELRRGVAACLAVLFRSAASGDLDLAKQLAPGAVVKGAASASAGRLFQEIEKAMQEAGG